MHHLTITDDSGTQYSILAVEGDDGLFRPDVAKLNADGEPTTKVVDAETTDEEYGDPRTCLLHGIAAVI